MAGLGVLQIVHDHPDWTPGGTEIAARDLTRALAARPGVRARLLAAGTRLHRPDATPGALQAHGSDFVIITGSYDIFSMLRQDGTAWLSALAQVVATVAPDVVHLHGLDRLGAEIVPALRRLLPSGRIVLTLHDYQVLCADEGLMLDAEGGLCPGPSPDRCRRCLPAIPAARHALRKAHLMAILAQVDVLVVSSEFLRQRLIDWGIAANRIEVIRNGVPLPAERGRQKPALPQGEMPNRFAMFGNLARHKGTLVALDAAGRLASAGADLRLNLHGGMLWADEEYRAAFAGLLGAAYPVAQHLGPYQRGEVTALMRRAHWVVVPSLWYENAPLVILEAQAAGRPVICSGIGGMAELVEDGVNGLHVPPGDAAALADTMRAAAGDRKLWARLAEGAEARGLDAHVDEHLALYGALSKRVAA